MAEVRLLLRDTVTGEEAWHVEPRWENDEDGDNKQQFYWTDGNAGCDCERARMLAAALGKPDPNIECGNVRIIVAEAFIDDKEERGFTDDAV